MLVMFHVKPLSKDFMVQMKMWIKLRNLSLKTEESLSLKLLTYWKSHLYKFRAFWNTIWTCVRFLPNLCPTCWEKRRRKIMSVCARTFKKGMKDLSKIITGDESEFIVMTQKPRRLMISPRLKKNCGMYLWSSQQCTSQSALNGGWDFGLSIKFHWDNFEEDSTD
jgi:hypothetical protein